MAESGPPILGWVHQYDLHIIINPHAPNQIMVVENWRLDDIIKDAEWVFRNEMGQLKGYLHKI